MPYRQWVFFKVNLILFGMPCIPVYFFHDMNLFRFIKRTSSKGVFHLNIFKSLKNFLEKNLIIVFLFCKKFTKKIIKCFTKVEFLGVEFFLVVILKKLQLLELSIVFFKFIKIQFLGI